MKTIPQIVSDLESIVPDLTGVVTDVKNYNLLAVIPAVEKSVADIQTVLGDLKGVTLSGVESQVIADVAPSVAPAIASVDTTLQTVVSDGKNIYALAANGTKSVIVNLESLYNTVRGAI